jgi:hypothetical protein
MTRLKNLEPKAKEGARYSRNPTLGKPSSLGCRSLQPKPNEHARAQAEQRPLFQEVIIQQGMRVHVSFKREHVETQSALYDPREGGPK